MTHWPLGLWLALSVCAWGQPGDGLAELPRRFYLDAEQAEARGEFDVAARGLRLVLQLAPEFERGWVDLGRVLAAAGDSAGAERALLRAADDVDAVEALGQLYLQEERYDAAFEAFTDMMALSPGSPRAEGLAVVARAHLDAVEAELSLRAWLKTPGVVRDDPLVADAVGAVLRGLASAQEEDLERRLLQDLSATLPVSLGLEQRLDRLEVRQLARVRAATPAPVMLSVAQLERLRRARAEVAKGELDAAWERLQELASETPNNPELQGTLADVAEARGDIEAAELAVQRALRLAPSDGRWHRRHAELLAAHYGGRYDLAAAEAFRRALSWPGTPAEVWVQKAEVEFRAGARERALASFRRYLELAPDGSRHQQVAAFLRDADRDLPHLVPSGQVQERPESLTEDSWLAFHRARVYAERGALEEWDSARRERDLDSALLELLVVRQVAPSFVPGINLEASLQSDLGKPAVAIGLYQQSVTLEPAQGSVLLALAALERQAGDHIAAEAAFEQAADLGEPDALFERARRAMERGDLQTARSELDRYFAGATAGVHHADAVALAAAVAERQRLERLGWLGAGTGAVLFGVGLPLGLWSWRRSGVGLEALLEQTPEAWPEVARLCAAIRHEVLKHNTTVLSAVADSLEAGDPELARFAADKLFGDHGAVARFGEYVGSLEQLGRSYGVQLNLRRRDPVLGPLIIAFSRLERLEGAMRAGRVSAATRLRQLSEALNQRGYQALGEFLKRVRGLQVDGTLLSAISDQVLAEPGVCELDAVVSVQIAEPVQLQLFRSELRDIVANLLRNGLQAGAVDGAAAVLLCVDEEEDPITALSWVCLRFADHSRRRLSNADLRAAQIERGLGLAVSVVRRHGGTVSVEPMTGWSKAVVVRLPAAEEV